MCTLNLRQRSEDTKCMAEVVSTRMGDHPDFQQHIIATLTKVFLSTLVIEALIQIQKKYIMSRDCFFTINMLRNLDYYNE